jgi:PKD repeat protein
MRRKLIPLIVVALVVPAATLQVASAASTTSVLVHFDKNTSAAAQKALIERVGGRKTSTIPRLGTAVVSVPLAKAEAVLSTLERLPGVSYAETDGVVHAYAVTVNDPYLNSSSWQLANPNFPDAWSLTTGSSNIVVAVVDTGVQPNHPDLGTLVPGYDFVNDDENTSDDEGHGTAVAGIVAAQGNNDQGIAGVCWQCRIMPVKVLDSEGLGTDSDVASGIVWAVDHRAEVINLSLGGPDSSQTLAGAVSYAQSRGVVVVAAAGNEGQWQVPDYPAAYPGVISVGAVGEADHYYDFSNWGSWVQVEAPGCTNTTHWSDIVRPDSLYYNLGDPDVSYYPTPSQFCGTSAAAPFVAGLAGLARSYNPSASALSIADAIEQTATPRPPVYGEGNSVYGFIDASAAIQAIALAPAGPQASFTPSVTAGGEPLRVTFTNTSTDATSYVWTFGDGSDSTTTTSPIHTFAHPGTYDVSLMATRSPGESTMAFATITVEGAQASFTPSVTAGLAPLGVGFTNTSTNATSYVWTFGDGSASITTTSPAHTFAHPGTFSVSLVATGSSGDSATASATITVKGPQASFTPSVTTGLSPLHVTFTNTSTNATSYVWSFGDGSDSTTTTSPVHTFDQVGTFSVSLVATGSSGDSATASATITANPPIVPVASFRLNRVSGTVPLTVTFTNGSSRAASYRWSFGDRTPSSIETSPQHTFTSSGTYEVTLTATGEGGSATTSRNVIVKSKAPSKPDLKVSLARTASRHDGLLHVDSLVATVSNRGLTADTQVKLRITLPVASGVKSVSAGGGSCTLAGRRITCSFGTVAGKKTVRASLVVSLPSGAKTTASASGGRAEASLANNSASIRSS